MAYSDKAAAQRRCRATKGNGELCRNFAVWDDSGLCGPHGRHHRGPVQPWQRFRVTRTRFNPCMCGACGWPHRPGGGLCRWPDPPLAASLIEAGTRSGPRIRTKRGWR